MQDYYKKCLTYFTFLSKSMTIWIYKYERLINNLSYILRIMYMKTRKKLLGRVKRFTETWTIQLTPELLDQLREYAFENSLTMGDIGRTAAKLFLDKAGTK